MPGRANRPQRSPYPGDIKIGTGLFMLAAPPKPTGPEVTGTHIKPDNAAAPQSYGYSSQNPEIEATESYHNLSGGFGMRLQERRQDTPYRPGDKRYRFASNADCSIAGQITLGPYLGSGVTPGTVDSTNGISGFYELGSTLYAVNGRYVQYRANDTTWTVSKDLGSGKIALDAIVAKQSGGATTYALIAMGDSEHLWYHDGASTTTTWTQHASLYALAFAQKTNRIYRANTTNAVAYCDLGSDFTVAANWSAATNWLLGDAAYPIVKLALNAGGVLVGLKQDGIHVVNLDGSTDQLYPGFKFSPTAENGKYPFLFGDYLHVTYAKSHVRLNPGMGLEAIGPERFNTNDAFVTGYITAGCGTAFNAYAGLYNPDSGHSYLMKFGGWDMGPEGEVVPVDTWHGSLSPVNVGSSSDQDTTTFSSRKITAMFRSAIGAPSGHERMWIGCSDGTIFNFILPCTANPLGCTSYVYNDASNVARGAVFFPYWNGGFASDEKVIRAVEITATSLGTVPLAKSGGIDFGIRAAGSGTSYTKYNPGGGQPNAPGTRWTVDRTQTLADMVLNINIPANSVATSTPVITGVGVAYRTNPLVQLIYEINIVCEDGQLRRDGSRMDKRARDIQTLIKAACNTTAGVTVVLPDESSKIMQLSGYTERLMKDSRTRQWRSVITVQATQSDAFAITGGVQSQDFAG